MQAGAEIKKADLAAGLSIGCDPINGSDRSPPSHPSIGAAQTLLKNDKRANAMMTV